MDAAAVADGLVARARAEGRAALYEHEAYALLETFGIRCPPHRFVPAPAAIPGATGHRTRSDRQVARALEPLEASSVEEALAALHGERVVVKAVSARLLHKSDVGGVRVVPRDAAAAGVAIEEMRGTLAAHDVVGMLVVEHVAHDTEPGAELLLSARWTDEFGPVVTVAPGGRHAEFLASQLSDDRGIGVMAAGTQLASSSDAFAGTAWVRLATEARRGSPPRLSWARLSAVVEALQRLAASMDRLGIRDCEINPAVIAHGDLVPLDALVTLGQGRTPALPRPTDKLLQVLAPRTIAVIGVSDRMNPGRVVLRNVLREGFPPDAITVIKADRDTIDGCRCVARIAQLPTPVDLLVVAVAARQVPAVIDEVVSTQGAAGVIVIPGGLEETREGTTHAARVRAALDAARAMPWRGPLVIGGNCLGIRSKPGRYDTLFIPGAKLASPSGPGDPVAVVAQSGAFAVARTSRWSAVPRYLVTLGNQMDVTLADVLEWLRGDPELAVFAVYVEGFKPGDGRRALLAAADITRSGRSVVLYRAGRTSAGAEALASHTASIAGDYRLTRRLFEQAGVMVADTIDAFDDLVAVALLLRDARLSGRRIAALSNAGFECVAIADWLGSLELASLGPETRRRLSALFEELRLEGLVDVHNPLDLTPMTDDAGYEAVLRTVLDAPEVDAAVVGCVPLTPALQTLPPADGGQEDVARADGIAARLARVRREVGKPFVVAVDAGARYDPFARILESRGVPTLRSAVRAVRALEVWTSARLRRATLCSSR